MYKLTVVIPTCNRSEYLYKSIKSIKNSYQEAQIVISDNSDNPEPVIKILRKFNYENIVYQYIEEKISVVENFESALKLADGKFVAILGDDDTLGIGVENILSKAILIGADALFCYKDRFIANYYWPGVVSKYFGSKYSASLVVKRFNNEWQKINPIVELKKVSNRLGGGLGAMPRIYHGIVKKDLLDNIRSKYGNLFGGVSPDIYSATLISLEANNVYYIDLPFILPGACLKSTAGQGASRTDKGSLNEVEHTARFGKELKWDAMIPKYYGPQNVWAYSLLCALNKTKVSIEPNYLCLYVKALINNIRHKDEVKACLIEYIRKTSYQKICTNLAVTIYVLIELYIKRIYWKYGKKNYNYSNVNDIENALEILKKYDL
jgi:glycosyltransferase involved in cell wall biosynthesis